MLLIVIFHAYCLTQNILSRQECQTDICICHGSSSQCRCYFHQTPYCEGYGPSQTCSTNPGCLGCDDNSSCIACISQKQFVDSSQNCVNCPELCQTCTSQSNCQSCITNNYYLDGGLCQLCEFPCQQCISQQNCLTCVSQQFYLISNICRQCDPPCLTCQNQTQCLTCIDNSYYLDQQQSCVQCQSPCLTCFNLNFCLSCVSESYELDNGQCIYQCSLNCQICENSLQCITCENGYYLDANYSCIKCQDQCQICLNQEICTTCLSQYYKKDYDCIVCQQPCLTCLDEQKCNSCIDGYYLQNQVCNLCPLNCLKCDQFRCYLCNTQSKLFNDQCIDCLHSINRTLEICNYQNCQDGIWTHGEECDNGNSYGCINCIKQNGYYCINVNGYPSQCSRCIDNCNKCEIETKCQLCKDGYFLNSNNQCQQCNIECKTCIYQPNNCLSCKISDQNFQQCHLCEINLGYYTDFENNQCYSKCGDNIKTILEQCDDGNNLNGDGCSSNCQIEDGFYCSDGRCDTLIQGEIQVSQQQANLNLPSKQFVIQFKNYLLNSDSEIIPIIQFLNCQINQSLIVVKQNITQENQFQHRVIEINIEFQNTCIKDKMEVSIVQKSKNNSKKSILLSFITFQIYDILFVEQWKQIFNDIMISFNQTLFYIFGFICIATFLTGTIEIVYNAIDLIQMFSYLKYINVNLPQNLQQYFDLFKFAQLQYFSNFTKQIALKFLTQKELDQNNFLPYKIQRDGYYSYCLLNYPFLFLLFAFVILLYPMAKLLLILLQNFQIRINEDDDDSIILKLKLIQLHLKLYLQRSCQYIINKLYFSGFIQTHIILTYDILFVSLLNLFDLKIQFTTKNTFILINLYIAIILTIIHCSLIFIYYSMLAKQTYLLEQKNYIRKCGSLFEGIKLGTHSCTHLYKLFTLIKKSLFMILITFCSAFPYCQSLSISFLSFIQILYLYNYKPIISIIEYRKQLVSECCVLLLSLFITLLILMHDIHYDMLFYSDILGWCSIILMSMLLLFQIILDIKQQFLLCQKNFILFHKILKSLQTKLQQVFENFGSTKNNVNSNVVLFY